MSNNVDQLILHSLGREHRQLKQLLVLLQLNLDRLRYEPSVRCRKNIRNILGYLGRQFSGPHCHKETTIHQAVRDIRNSDPGCQGRIDNEYRIIEALLKKAADLPLEAPEAADKERCSALSSLGTILYNHIEIEETIRLPLARECLTDEDWQQVSRAIRRFPHEIRGTADPAITEIESAREYRRIVISARLPPAPG